MNIHKGFLNGIAPHAQQGLAFIKQGAFLDVI